MCSMVTSPLPGQRIWVSVISPFPFAGSLCVPPIVSCAQQGLRGGCTQGSVLQKEVAPKANLGFGSNS